MYSVARSPPRLPTPRPSSKSLARKRVWARMRSAEIAASWPKAATTVIISNPIDFNMIALVSLEAVRMNHSNGGGLAAAPTQTLTYLQTLEAESIHIIREVAAEFERPVMLYSIGKDSSVM